MTRFEKNLRFSIGNIIGNSPYLFWINGLREDFKDKIVTRDTELCVEGFQRSGNSFFTMLIKREKNTLKLADHVHVSQQVIRACKLNIPTIVLIRHPKDAIASILAWDPKLSVSLALRSYFDFYNSIWKYREQFVVGHFDTVISEPYKIIQEANSKFAIRIKMDEFEKARLERMRDRWVNRTKNMQNAPVPNEKKEMLKQSFLDQIENEKQFSEVQQLFESYLKISV